MTESLYAASWSGTARLGLGWGLFTGLAGDNRPHAHHAIQIVLSETPQRIWTAAQGWQTGHGAIIAADVQHRLEASRAPVTLLYIEPDSVEGRRAMAHAPSDALLPAALVSSALERARTSPDPIPQVVDNLFQALPPRPALQRDPMIETLIDALPKTLPERFGIAAMAAQTGLSPSRVQHRFRAHTGLAIRPYLRWRRLLTAMTNVTLGLPLTDAATEAGFSDAAHFTRTFCRHFGITPSVLLRLQT